MDESVEALRAQLQRLEAKVRELTDRIGNLERYNVPRVENPIDQASVRQKVTYDWQS